MNQLLILILSLLPLKIDNLDQDELDGIFLAESYHQNCQDSRSFEVDEEKYCITNNPIIGVEDFKSVSNIFLDFETLTDALILVLNEDGSEKLKLLSQIFQGRVLALVIENRLAGFIRINREVEEGRIKIYGEKSDSDLDWVRQELLQIIEENKKVIKNEKDENQN